MDKEELKSKLSAEEYHVTQEGGTEKPFDNKYWNSNEAGMYTCKVCGQTLFASDTKVDSSKGPIGLQGWPAFEDAIPGSVEFKEDNTIGMKRTEVVCSKCKSHLGHLFDDSDTKTSKHFCVNSCAIDFKSN